MAVTGSSPVCGLRAWAGKWCPAISARSLVPAGSLHPRVPSGTVMSAASPGRPVRRTMPNASGSARPDGSSAVRRTAQSADGVSAMALILATAAPARSRGAGQRWREQQTAVGVAVPDRYGEVVGAHGALRVRAELGSVEQP